VPSEGLQDFSYAFLSILLEGAPFILVGTILSGFIDVYLPPRAMERLLPRSKSAAVLLSGLLGIIFPVCECAVVPVIRRLVRKGLPVSCALTYMLAAPIVNPVTALSTYKAFSGQDPLFMTGSRLALGYLVAIIVGFALLRIPIKAVLKSSALADNQKPDHDDHDHEHADCDHDHHEHDHEHDHEHGHDEAHDPSSCGHDHAAAGSSRLTAALRSALRDFTDVGVYFAIGITITALFNTRISMDAGWIKGMAEGTVSGPVALMALAFLLSLCSTSDAFIAATLHLFGYGSRLAFLVFGPMMDIKLLFLYSTVLKRRFIIILALSLFVLIGGLSIYWQSIVPT
jgi:uncharacterized membrane protein YraQ (UPF0718 family)